MNYVIAITDKGQATIPVVFRNKLGLKPKTKVSFGLNSRGELVLKPVVDFFSLKGSVKSKKAFDIDKMDKAISGYIKNEYSKKVN